MTTSTDHQTGGGPAYAAFVGIDRSDRKIDVTVLDPSGGRLGQREISSGPDSLEDWIADLRAEFPEGRLALCIEQPCANLAAFFSRYDFVELILVNPATYRKWHDAFGPSKAHDDVTDGAGLAELAQQNHAKLTVWKPDDSPTRKLRSLVESRRSLVDLRTRLNNQLVALLKNYFPQALELTGRYPTAVSPATFSPGIAPVLKQSGNTRLVHRRFACPAFHRQSFLEWVGQTITRSRWARAFYEQRKDRGATTYTARRALAHKWICIIWRCWQDRTPYDEQQYLDALSRLGSPLADTVRQFHTADKTP